MLPRPRVWPLTTGPESLPKLPYIHLLLSPWVSKLNFYVVHAYLVGRGSIFHQVIFFLRGSVAPFPIFLATAPSVPMYIQGTNINLSPDHPSRSLSLPMHVVL
jgi:hypothetical protein